MSGLCGCCHCRAAGSLLHKHQSHRTKPHKCPTAKGLPAWTTALYRLIYLLACSLMRPHIDCHARPSRTSPPGRPSMQFSPEDFLPRQASQIAWAFSQTGRVTPARLKSSMPGFNRFRLTNLVLTGYGTTWTCDGHTFARREDECQVHASIAALWHW